MREGLLIKTLQGTGLGLRRAFLNELREILPQPVDFLEVAPENWMNVGGSSGKKFAFYADHYPIVCHGLSLSLGSPAPLDLELLDNIKIFLDRYGIESYSEHLSYCSDHHGHLYDLLPIPFTLPSARYVATRIKQVQSILNRPIAIENISYYCAPGQQMPEIEFILTVLEKADCQLLLDVNNVYVNAQNHGYDPRTFIHQLPTSRIQLLHVSGHSHSPQNIIIDTHGEDVIDPVWDLLQFTYETHGVLPTVLERDNNIPPIETLIQEVQQIKHLQQRLKRDVYA
jgi:uncharacterized protein